VSWRLRPLPGGSICARPRVGMIGSGCGVGGVGGDTGVTEAASRLGNLADACQN
jgi:hypothetical protein